MWPGDKVVKMLADFYRDGVHAATLKKIMRLLDSYAKTPAGEVVYGHIEQMLHAFESEEDDKQQLLCSMMRMVLDAFSTHLDPDSGLFTHIRTLQTRLTPPLNLTELNALNEYMEFTADEITRFSMGSSAAMTEAMKPLFDAFSNRESVTAEGSSQAEDRRAHGRRRLDLNAEDNVHYLKRRAQLTPADPASGEFVAVAGGPLDFRQEISESVAQSEEFGALLEIELSTLRQLDNLEDFEARKRAVTRELETVLQRHRQLTGQFGKVNSILNQVVGDSERLNQELDRVTRLSLTDELTGLPNRRAFVSRLHEEVSRVQRYGHDLAIAIIDLDDFKLINDSLGHPAGDAVLETYASKVLVHFREHDLVARYGGEEFAVIFPNTQTAGAQRALHKIQAHAATTRCHFDGQHIALPTFSAGLATYHAGESMDALIKRADEALYQAKEQGRNQVVTAAMANS